MKATLSLPGTLAVFTLLSISSAHTWLENLRTIASNGTFIGPAGFPRGYVTRGSSPGPDQASVFLIKVGSKMCGPSQQIGNQAAKFPALQAAPGDNVALRYLENGHVTKLEPGRPARGGIVYVYGTKKPSNDDTYDGIHKVWNAAGTGGDKRGRLLATRPYDDGQCYQVRPEPPSEERQAQFPKAGEKDADLICQSDIQIPTDAGTDGDYTLYWVWDWPIVKADGSIGKNESYTACADIKLVSKSITASAAGTKFVDGQMGNTHAIKEQMQNQYLIDPSAQPALTTAPAFTLPSSAAPQQPAPSSQAPQQPSSSTRQSSSKPTSTSASPPAVSSQPPALGGGNDRFITVTVTASAQQTITVTDYIIIKPDATTIAQGTATAIPSSYSSSKSASSSSSAPAASPTTVTPTGPPANIRPFLPAPTPSAPAINGTTVYGRLFRRRDTRRARF